MKTCNISVNKKPIGPLKQIKTIRARDLMGFLEVRRKYRHLLPHSISHDQLLNLKKEEYRISAIIYCRTIIRPPTILNDHPCSYLLQKRGRQKTEKWVMVAYPRDSFCFVQIEKHKAEKKSTSCDCVNSEEERKFSSPKGSSICDATCEPKQNTSFFSRYDLDSEFALLDPSFFTLVIFVHPIPC